MDAAATWYYKMNTDASVKADRDKMGLGFVVRDWQGRPLAAICGEEKECWRLLRLRRR